MTKDFANVTIPGIYDESFEVPREHTRAWDPSHSLYLEVRVLYLTLSSLLRHHRRCSFACLPNIPLVTDFVRKRRGFVAVAASITTTCCDRRIE